MIKVGDILYLIKRLEAEDSIPFIKIYEVEIIHIKGSWVQYCGIDRKIVGYCIEAELFQSPHDAKMASIEAYKNMIVRIQERIQYLTELVNWTRDFKENFNDYHFSWHLSKWKF